MLRLALLVSVAVLTAVPARAQPAPEGESGRFTFNKAEDGYLRLDTRTGQVSLCARKPVGWACSPVPDERNALEAEIARLQNDNGLLKKELLARNIALPGTVRPDQPAAKENQPTVKLPEVELKLPSDSDLDRVFSFMDKVWRRFTDKMGAIQRDYFGGKT